MSRIGKMPIAVPDSVQVTLEGQTVTCKGSKGEMQVVVNPLIKVKVVEKEVVLERASDEAQDKALHGLNRSLVANAIEGVEKGFEKKLEVIGVGFKVAKKGEGLELGLGFSHPVEVTPLPGVKIDIDPENKMGIVITGVDKQQVGEMAARIRKLKKPEPYKGKGIKYAGEQVRRKAGKAAGSK